MAYKPEEIDISELDAMYRSVMHGVGEPDVVAFFCKECNESFILIRDSNDNTICQHMRDYFNQCP